MNFKSAIKWAALPLVATASASPAYAGEGGGSVYTQGTKGDFAMAVVGPPGVYVRNDTFIYTADVAIEPPGLPVAATVDQELLADLVKVVFVPKGKIAGAQPQLVVILPVVLDVDVAGGLSAPPGGITRSGSATGLGDLVIVPSLAWADGKHHYQFEVKVYAPTGSFSSDEVLNLSKNHWAFDPTFTYTYLDPMTGTDVSVAAGMVFNTTNSDTGYTTGNEFHVDATVAKHFPSGWALGVTGYWYEQISDDEGNLPPFGSPGFQGRGIGIGPAVSTGVKIGGSDVTLIAKWLHDVETRNRLNGDLFMFSMAMKL